MPTVYREGQVWAGNPQRAVIIGAWGVFALIGLSMLADGQAGGMIFGAMVLLWSTVYIARTWLGLSIVRTNLGVQVRGSGRWRRYAWSDIDSFGVQIARVGMGGYARKVLVLNLKDGTSPLFRALNTNQRRDDLDRAVDRLNEELRSGDHL